MNVDDFLRRELNRRRFLGHGAAGAAGMAATAVGISRPVAAASPADSIRLGVIGARSQGRRLAEEAVTLPGVHIGAVCDVDAAICARVARSVKEAQSAACHQSHDFRRVLDDPSIDAVVVATPDHWHALMTILACQAGKHVYVEKPASLTVEEGRRMVQVARNTGLVVQCGLQQRSGTHFQSAIDLVRSGEIGQVRLAKAWSAQRRKSIGNRADSPVPQGVDYDLWLGPAPERPFNPNRFHYHWRWNWDYGTGELGNWGTHLLDIARWGLDVGLPDRIAASGGKLYFDDDQQTPDTLTVSYSYPQATIQWEHRLWTQHGVEGRSAAVAFYGDNGTLIVDRSGWKVYDRHDTLTADASELRRTHLENFVESVRGRARPNCDLVTAHVSSALSHLGNIAYRLNREIRFDSVTSRCRDDAEANSLLSRNYRRGFELPTA